MHYLKAKKYFVSLGNLSNSKSVGTNNLIKEFAFITTEPEDILSYLGFIKPIENNNIEKAKAQIIENIPIDLVDIYKVIDKNPIDVNEISKKSNLDLKSVMSKLTMLELEGRIRKISGNRYIRGDE